MASTTIDKNLFAQIGETPEAYIQRTQAYKSSSAYTVPSTTSTTPLPAGDVGAVTPLKLAPESPATAGGGLEQYITASTDGIDLQQQEAMKEAEKSKTESQGAYATILQKFGMQPQRSEEIYQQEGVDQKKRAVDNYTQQIRSEQLANRRQVEELRASGMQNRSSFNDEVTKINRESLSKQADLAILQNAAVDNYNTASAIADRKIKFETETLKAEADYYKFFYEENKADFTKAEDRYYSSIAQEKQNAYQQAVTEKKTLSDMKLEMLKSAASQGAPDSILQAIQGAQTPEAAISSAGQYAGDILDRQEKQMHIANMQSQINERAAAQAESEQLYAGLSSATATAVRAKVNKFSSEPVVQGFATVQEGYNFANALSDTTKNPADDQALIYALAKALDPGSVVREGEYATAQKYAQSWVQAYGKNVTQALAGTGFLSETARKNIKATIATKYNASKTSYDNLYKNTATSVNSLTGRDDGTKFLIDYTIPEVPSAPISGSGQTSSGIQYEVVTPTTGTPSDYLNSIETTKKPFSFSNLWNF